MGMLFRKRVGDQFANWTNPFAKLTIYLISSGTGTFRGEFWSDGQVISQTGWRPVCIQGEPICEINSLSHFERCRNVPRWMLSMDVSYFANGFVQYANWSSTRLRNKLPIASEFASERSRTTRNLYIVHFANGFNNLFKIYLSVMTEIQELLSKKSWTFIKKFELLYVWTFIRFELLLFIRFTKFELLLDS